MDAKQTGFPEQEAPEKNTDDAFVQVGKDGHPVIPSEANDKVDKEPSMPEAEKSSRK